MGGKRARQEGLVCQRAGPATGGDVVVVLLIIVGEKRMEDGCNVVGNAQSSCSLGRGWGLIWTLYVQEIRIQTTPTVVIWSVCSSLGYATHVSHNIFSLLLQASQSALHKNQSILFMTPFFPCFHYERSNRPEIPLFARSPAFLFFFFFFFLNILRLMMSTAPPPASHIYIYIYQIVSKHHLWFF